MGFRLAFVRLFNRRGLSQIVDALEDPAAAQRASLQRLLHRHAGAGYLRHHGALPGMDADALRRALPITDYEGLRPWIEPLVQTGQPGPRGSVVDEPVSMFLKTSGTTGAPKLLPVTPSYEEENDRAQRFWVERMLSEDERNALGRHLTLVSPHHEGLTPGGIPYGSNTGRLVMRQPQWLRAFAAAPYEVGYVGDFSLRYYLVLRHAVGLADVGTLSTANPSTVLLLCRMLLEHGGELADDIEAGRLCGPARLEALRALDPGPMVERAGWLQALGQGLAPDPGRARRVRQVLQRGAQGLLGSLWPQLTTVNCWQGGHAPFYLKRLEPFLATDAGALPLRDPGFSASEGFFGIPLRSGTSEGLLHVTGPWMEFVPEEEADPQGAHTLLAHELEVGRRYQLLVTTGGGLWRYQMRDVLEVTGKLGQTPLVRFLYKAGSTLSITGEKVTEGHAIAVATALHGQLGLENLCATLALEDPPFYLVAVEPAPGQALDAQALAQAWDTQMRRVNVEYDEKRSSGRLAPARARLVPPGAFVAWRRRRVAQGAPDGQVKMPPLLRSVEQLGQALWPQES